MSAKSELFVRLKYLSAASNLPNLIDQGIAISEHNGVANILRKGLGIVAFNILEDFIKNKAIEALSSISSSLISFNNLTPSLQESATLGALQSLSFRSSVLKKEGGDWMTLIQEEALKIHSTMNPTYQISKFALANTNSNVAANEIGDFLKAFGVSGGWNTLKAISDRIGGGLPDLAQAYNNASQRRHNAAHSANFQYDYAWIAGLKNEILAICAALDIVITARCRQVNDDHSKSLELHDINSALNYRFLEASGIIFKETMVINGRSRKNWSNLDLAIAQLQPRLNERNEFLIVLNSAKRIENWYV